MKKFSRYAMGWAISFLVFNLIIFVIPDKMNGYNKFYGAFSSGYLGIIAAYIINLICAKRALREDNLSKIFLRIPLIKISYSGLISTFIVGVLLIIIPDFPDWLGIILVSLISLGTIIAVLKADTAAETIIETEAKVKAATGLMKSLIAQAKILETLGSTEQSRKACAKVYETFKYSDPVSVPELDGIEEVIKERLTNFINTAKTKDEAAIIREAEELSMMIAERNNQCKVLK